jgi:hypothetical protein
MRWRPQQQPQRPHWLRRTSASALKETTQHIARKLSPMSNPSAVDQSQWDCYWTVGRLTDGFLLLQFLWQLLFLPFCARRQVAFAT